MTNPIGVMIIAIIMGLAVGYFLRGEYFNKKTYATTIGLGLFIDVFLGSFPFYHWDISVELPVSMIFISAVIGLFIGKAVGGR
ncbi:MAG: hypothetical protein JW825_01020 [Candidatus Methanofastidiosa archaeon]|nr:hypothetical protein [Candidatus Methanofastidiosa archaeon]